MINNSNNSASQSSFSIADWKAVVENHLAKAARPLIVLVGPTASGKTSLSLEIAHLLKENGRHAEIVNADSRQLYQHLNIGTAKITSEEKADVPHHLLDVLDPSEEVTIAWYKREAERCIDEILSHDSVPLLVGGSMLYISAVIDGLEPLATDPALRASLEKEYDIDAGAMLMKRLEKIDPEVAASIPRQNKVYLVRALEIVETTGESPRDAKKKNACPYDLLILGLQWPREELIRRIQERTQIMFRDGWIEEVRSLMQKGYKAEDPAMKSHGYREIVSVLQTGSIDEEALTKAIEAKTKQYAKRQMTWWRGDSRIHWIAPITSSVD